MGKKTGALKTHGKVAAAAEPVATDESLLAALLEHLMYMRQQLLKLDPDTLDDKQHEQWRNEVNQVSLAISKVRNSMLAALNAEFATALPDIESAADRLTDDLYKLQAANEIIGAIAEGIGVVAKILALLP